MRGVLLLAGLLMVLGIGFVVGAGQKSAGMDMSRLGEIPERMESFIRNGRVAGMVTLVARHGQVVQHRAYGNLTLGESQPMRRDSLFHIASMTKPVTAVAVMTLVEDGRLALTDPVSRHLPAFGGLMLKGEPQRQPARAITVRDLLTHTSGMAGRYPERMKDLFMTRDLTLAEAVEAFAHEPLEFEPGLRWGYSNMGIATLGRLVEVISGEPFERYVERRIFGPLGMRDSHFFVPGDKLARVAGICRLEGGRLVRDNRYDVRPNARYAMPEGGLYSTAGDLFRFYQAMLDGGSFAGRRVLSPAAVEVMTRVHTGEMAAGFSPGIGFGLGWAVVRNTEGMFRLNSVGTFGHGGLFKTYGFIDPSKDLVGIILMQRLSDDGDLAPEFNAFMAMTSSSVIGSRAAVTR